MQVIKTIKELRSRGFSLPEIYKKTGVGYGSVFRHIKNVEILPEYKSLWAGKRKSSVKRKLDAEVKAISLAEKTISNLSDKDKAIIFASLYWAEGNKKDFNFTNTDPEMIRVFTNILRCLDIPKERLRVTIRIYEDLNKEKCIDYWAKIVGIPPSKIVNVNIIKGKKIGKLKYGMCRIRIVKGGNMLKYAVALRNQVIKLLN